MLIDVMMLMRADFHDLPPLMRFHAPPILEAIDYRRH